MNWDLECRDCYDSGFIWTKYKPEEPDVFVFCHCKKGNTQVERRLDCLIPQWELGKMDKIWGFEKNDFPYKDFIPKRINDPSEKYPVTDYQEKIDLMLNRIKFSLNYWEKKVRG